MNAETAARRPAIVPNACVLLGNWRYVEESILRILAGWGRCAGDWEDKLAACYHVWLQAESVDWMRKRIDMFPGGNANGPAHADLAALCNAVLLAPSWRDAMAGLHELLNPALQRAYTAYAAQTHPVHDLPTKDLLEKVLALKQKQASWYADFSRRYPHHIDAAYGEGIARKLAELGGLRAPVECMGAPAAPCGKETNFQMPVTPGRVKDWNLAPNIMPYLELDWSHSVEARRLFFIVGYTWEMGVAEQQLRWIYHADFMPWEFIHVEARHLWDESRHGDSGFARLKEFGLGMEHIGYSSYGATGDGFLPPMTPQEVYQAFYGVTQIAETGYFETKRYCFDDFMRAGDDASAEMMQFDIIDETSHVEYGKQWLETMMRRAGIHEDYRQRGAGDRLKARQKSDRRVESYRSHLAGLRQKAESAAHGGDSVNPTAVPAFEALDDAQARRHYESLIRELRTRCPLRNADRAPIRPNLPM